MPNPGMSPEILEAMKRRDSGQAPSPALNQVSPGAAMSQPMSQPMPSSELTQASGPAGAATPEPPKMPKFEPQDRQDLITLALIEQLKNDGKLQKEQNIDSRGSTQEPPAPVQQSPQPAPTPQGAPMGGGGEFSMSPGFEQPMPVNQMQSNYNNGMGKDYSGLSGYGK